MFYQSRLPTSSVVSPPREQRDTDVCGVLETELVWSSQSSECGVARVHWLHENRAIIDPIQQQGRE